MPKPTMTTTDWRCWAVGSSAFAALTAILAKVGVQGIGSNLATAIRSGVIVVFAWTLVWSTGEIRCLSALSARTWLFLVFSGLATGLSWVCYFRALQLGEASRVAPLDKLSVVFVLVLGALFLGERLKWQQWMGGALIAAGAILLALKRA